MAQSDFRQNGFFMDPKSGEVWLGLLRHRNTLSLVLTGFVYLFPVSTDLPVAVGIKPESPYVNSPRKSGRAPTRNRMFDEEWVTESPGRNRGRGRGQQSSSPGYGKR